MRTPRIYFGTMTFGWTGQTSSIVDETVASEMIHTFVTAMTKLQEQQQQPEKDGSIITPCHIDTARIYAGGKTESIVSFAIQQVKEQQQLETKSSTTTTKPSISFRVGTKAHPSQEDGLSPIGIQKQLEVSQLAMPNISSSYFDEYYLHQPDPNHPLLQSLQYLHQLHHEQGIIGDIGMSNYHVLEMQRAFDLCQEHNLTPPTVYQGLYNPINRLVEEELIPFLQQNNCSFVAYNPLAGGFLSGKYHTATSEDPIGTTIATTTTTTTTTSSSSSSTESTMTTTSNIPPGRFKDNPNYIPRFYTNANFQAVSIIQQACNDVNITMIDATYRWMMYHSKLTANDGILIGASSIQQLQQNLNSVCHPDTTPSRLLPQSVLDAFDIAWSITKKAGVFPYWRSYSSDMPNREQLDHGASYDAVKK